MATTEHTINDALAEVLTETRSLWRYKGVVRSENIDVLKGSGKRPDILTVIPHFNWERGGCSPSSPLSGMIARMPRGCQAHRGACGPPGACWSQAAAPRILPSGVPCVP